MFALADFDLLLEFPGFGRHVFSMFIGGGMGLLILRRNLKAAAAILMICAITSFALTEAGRRHGVLGNRQDVMDDIVVKTYTLRTKLEAAHASNVEAKGWNDLTDAGLIDSSSEFDTRYYSHESFTWRAEFDSAGKFVGSIHVLGDKKRNVPSFTVNYENRKLSKAQLGEYNELLPCFSRD